MKLSPRPRVKRPTDTPTVRNGDLAPARHYSPNNPPGHYAPPSSTAKLFEFKLLTRFDAKARMAAQVRILGRKALVGRHITALDPNNFQRPASREFKVAHHNLLTYFDQVERGLEVEPHSPWQTFILVGLLLRMKVLHASLNRGQRNVFESVYGIRLSLLRHNIEEKYPFLLSFAP